MKHKITKILGLGLTVALLASLILVAAPVSAGTIAWTTVSTPNPVYEQLQEGTDVDVLVMAPDGETMFAYSNSKNLLGEATLYPHGTGTAVWSGEKDVFSAKFTTPGDGGWGNTAEVRVPCNEAFSTITPVNITFTYYAVAHPNPYPMLFLDTDGDDEAEMALAGSIVATHNQTGAWVTTIPIDEAHHSWIEHPIVGYDPTTGEYTYGSQADSYGTLALAQAAYPEATLVGVSLGYGGHTTPATLYVSDITIKGGLLYKSTNAGVTWTTTSIGGTLEGNPVVAMAVSPNYADDSTLVAATADTVYRSINGGVSFGEVNTTDLRDTIDGSITSIDLAMYYTGGQLAILVGSSTGDQGGTVALCRMDNWDWVDQDAGTLDALAVAFSPNHLVDAQILAVVTYDADNLDADNNVTTDTDVVLTTMFAGTDWGAQVLDCVISGGLPDVDDFEPTHACIAFADDYEWSIMNRVLIGTAGGSTTLDDVYRMHGALPGGSSAAYDLNLSGSASDTDVYSIAVSGDIVGASVVVGLQDSLTVKRTSDPTASTVTWLSCIKAPIGDATNPDTTVIMSPYFDTDDTVYAGTDGANSCFSVSTDGGIMFNGIALIEVSDTADIDYVDSAIVDDDTMFVLIHDNWDETADFDAAETQMVFKTTDGGATWVRVLFHKTATGGTEGLSILGVSPDYAADETLYVAQNDSRIWKSSDGGGRFIGLAAPKAITALTVVDGSNYFTGHITYIYKSGRWNSGSIATGDEVKSIALSPDFAEDDTVFVGSDDGEVFYSTNASATAGVKYTKLGSGNDLGIGNNVVVTPHPEYADNSTIFAGSDGANTNNYATDVGAFRWVVGTSGSWFQLDSGTDWDGADGDHASPADNLELLTTGLVVSADGTLYAASSKNADATATDGVRRSVSPTAATVTACGFESVTTTLPGAPELQNLAYLPGSNELYAIASRCTTSTAYPHGWRLITLTDTFAITPTLVAPDEGESVGTSVKLSWEAIPAPAGETVIYTYQVATDEKFSSGAMLTEAMAADPIGSTTTGTSITVTKMTAGKKYYWRVYVKEAPLTTRKAIGSFVVKLGAAELTTYLSSPAPGASDMPIRPNFQWAAVSGATSYELQLADNADFTGATTKTLTVNVWACDTDLEYSTVYYWKVRAISADTESGWSTGVFTTAAEPVEEAPPEITVEIPAPEVTVEIPAPEVTVEAPPPAEITVEAPPPAEVTVSPPEVTVQAPPAEAPETPAYMWAIIVIGAVLVIALIVLIVRTRRAV